MKKVFLVAFVCFCFATNVVAAEVKYFPAWAVSAGVFLLDKEVRIPVSGGEMFMAALGQNEEIFFLDGQEPYEKKMIVETPTGKIHISFNLMEWNMVVRHGAGDEESLRLEPLASKIQRGILRAIVVDNVLPLEVEQKNGGVVRVGKEKTRQRDYPCFAVSLFEGKYLVVTDRQRLVLFSVEHPFFTDNRWQYAILWQARGVKGWRGQLINETSSRSANGGATLSECLMELRLQAWKDDIRRLQPMFTTIGGNIVSARGTLDGWYEVASRTRASTLWLHPEGDTFSAVPGRGWNPSASATREGRQVVIEEINGHGKKDVWTIFFIEEGPDKGSYKATKVEKKEVDKNGQKNRRH